MIALKLRLVSHNPIAYEFIKTRDESFRRLRKIAYILKDQYNDLTDDTTRIVDHYVDFSPKMFELDFMYFTYSALKILNGG